MPCSRRSFVTSVAGGAVSIPAFIDWPWSDDDDDEGVSTIDEAEEQFGVSIEYDEEWLERYQPAFVASRPTRQRYIGFYGAKVTSEEYDHDVGVFWNRLSHQDGLPLVRRDGHLYDHEPALSFVDPDTGEVDALVYTYWHHLADVVTGSRLDEVLFADRAEHPTHPSIEVVDKWHQYVLAPDATDADREFRSVEDWTAVVESWERNGIFQSTADEAVYDPGTMFYNGRGGWWDEDTRDYRLVQAYRPIAEVRGWWGGEEADLDD